MFLAAIENQLRELYNISSIDIGLTFMNEQLDRARSVVRISQRSSEPQVKGSKPFGPAVISLLY